MTTKLTLLALLVLPAFAAPQVLQRPGDDNAAVVTLAPDTGNVSQVFTIIGDYPAKSAAVFLVTRQEASDVLKALEIFAGPEPSEWPDLLSPGSPRQVTLDAVFIYRGDSPDELRRRAHWLESVSKAREQRRKDLEWAAQVMENWRAKIKEAK